MMRIRFLPALLGAVVIVPVLSASAEELKTEKQKFSYTVGFQVGQSLKRDGLELDVKAFSQAVEDVLSGAQPQLSMDQMKAAINTFREKQMEEKRALAEKNKKEGEAFLAANKKKKGVKTLPDGLQYQVIKAGTGATPKATDTVEVNYRGTLLDGKEFDSSYKRGKPTTLQVGGVIKGWQSALEHMKVGGKWKVWVPSDLAYGERGAGNVIGPNETLVFEIELLDIKSEPKAEQEKGASDKK
jgi:FKBP-type peptidyl-prolyl cis-trans isomerase FklB